MPTQLALLDISVVAAEDLSSDQYRYVVLSSSGVRRPDSEAEVALGVLQNAPAFAEIATVRVYGISKLHVNAALGVGATVMPEYVSATDAGKGKTSAGDPKYTRGMIIEASDAEDDLASVLLTGPFPGINDAVSLATTVLTDATAGAKTYTAANLIGGLILRDPNGADRSDVSPAAALIVAGIAGAVVGSSFEFLIRNTADGDETITLTAGVGVTLSGTMTIKRYSSRRFLAVCTNVTGGAEAVTIYSLGSRPDKATEAAYGVVAAGNHTTTGGNAVEDIEVTGALLTDIPIVTVKDDGTNNRTLLASAAKAGNITCTFSGDPGNDLIVNYIVLRALA